MSTLSEALKIYNVYKTFNEAAEPDLKTSVKGPVQEASHHLSASFPPKLTSVEYFDSIL